MPANGSSATASSTRFRRVVGGCHWVGSSALDAGVAVADVPAGAEDAARRAEVNCPERAITLTGS